MKIVYSWLKDFIDLDLTPEEMVQQFVHLGIEVAGVQTTGADFEGVTVAQITHIEDHPNSDHLHLVDLDLGGGKTQRVVCGAPNIAVGQKIPLARVGSRLGNMVMKPAVIRGVASEGMICSSDELGLTHTRAHGILVLDEKLELGTDVSTLYGKKDTVFDLEITSNRPDLLSHLGVARELGVLLNKPVKLPQIPAFQTQGEALHVEIQAPQACPRYIGRVIRGVKNTESPEFIKERLAAMGLNPKNALVDITNYVMFELGHPLHAFDRTEVDGDKVIIRFAHSGEKFTILDGRELELAENSLVIADDKKATALAGIMGGLNSGIQENTQDVFIESAYFDAPTINKTVKKFGVSSDSSQRFERGTDIEGALLAMNRATQLICQICGGTPSALADEYPEKFQNPEVVFTAQDINNILGTQLDAETLKGIFSRLGASFTADGDTWAFRAPSYRRDLTTKWDLAEEAARFVGYDAIPLAASKATVSFADNPKGIDLTKKFSNQLIGLGFYECKNIDFLGEKELKQFGFEPKHCIRIKNAMAQGWEFLRPTLLPALLKNVEFNQKRGQHNLALFESTKTFTLLKNYPGETYTVAGVLTGAIQNRAFFAGGVTVPDFYFVKGVVHNLLPSAKLVPAEKAPVYMHPKIAVDIMEGGKKIGVLGKLHPLTLKAFGIKTPEVWAFEFGCKALEKTFSAQNFNPVVAPAVFPPSLRDLSVVLDENISCAQVQSVLDQTGLDVKMSYELIDLYQGEHLPAGKKSLTFSLAFSNPQRTLKDAETDAAFNKIVAELGQKLGAALR